MKLLGRAEASTFTASVKNERLFDWQIVSGTGSLSILRLRDLDGYSVPFALKFNAKNGRFVELLVHNRKINDNHKLIASLNLPEIRQTCRIQLLRETLVILRDIESLWVECSGCVKNVDAVNQNAPLSTKDLIEWSDFGARVPIPNGQRYQRTIRSLGCLMLIPKLTGVRGRPKARCDPCETLRTNQLRRFQSDSRPGSSASDDSRRSSVSSQDGRILLLERKVDKLRLSNLAAQLKLRQARKLYDIPADHTIARALDSILHDDKPSNLSLKTVELMRCQLSAVEASDTRQVRYSPAVIDMSLKLHGISSAAYDFLQREKILRLPSSRQLQNYRAEVDLSGFWDTLYFVSGQFLEKFPKIIDRVVGLVFDEVYIKKHIVYHRGSRRFLGYQAPSAFIEAVDNLAAIGADTSLPSATQCLVVMLQAVYHKFAQPILSVPYHGSVPGHHLFNLLHETIEKLEFYGLQVHYVTGDGISANRLMFKLHDEQRYFGGTSRSRPLNRAPHPIRKGDYIYFLSDPPHLMKTARNCFASRRLWNNGEIQWKLIIDLFELENNQVFRAAYKLTADHVYQKTSFQKMKTKFAVQVLSRTVASALEMYFPAEEIAPTTEFIRNMDKFFDILNVRALDEADRRNDPVKRVFDDPADSRLSWLSNDFISYLENWEAAAKRYGVGKCLSVSNTKKMLLSDTTIEGLKLTALSAAQLVIDLLRKYPKNYILTSWFSQDRLEQYFAYQRQRGGACENPTIASFESSQKLRLMTTATLSSATLSSGTNVTPEISPPKKKARQAIKL